MTGAESVDALAVQVQADVHGHARLWLDYVMLTDAVPDDAQWTRHEAEIPPAPDWSLSLADVRWAARARLAGKSGLQAASTPRTGRMRPHDFGSANRTAA